jgi:ribosomal-protein-alanine N-acetyltransferase
MTPAQMAGLHARCFTVPRPWSAAEIAQLVTDPQVYVLHQPSGFLIGRCVAGEAELLTVAVAPEARRQGLGARLVSGFVTEALVRGAEVAFLEVAEDNAPALALYHAQGFSTAGRRRAYYRTESGGAIDALVLSRPLSRHASAS